MKLDTARDYKVIDDVQVLTARGVWRQMRRYSRMQDFDKADRINCEILCDHYPEVFRNFMIYARSCTD